MNNVVNLSNLWLFFFFSYSVLSKRYEKVDSFIASASGIFPACSNDRYKTQTDCKICERDILKCTLNAIFVGWYT